MKHYQDIYNALKEKVGIQDNACKALAMCSYKYLLKQLAKKDYQITINDYSNVLLIGKTGSGKSTLLHALATYLDLPLFFINGKSLVPEGWCGVSFPQLIMQKLREYGGNSILTNGALVVIDEFDKGMASNSSNDGDVGLRFQHIILPYLEGSVCRYEDTWKCIQEFDTKNFLFILAGTFDGLFKEQKQIGLVQTKEIYTSESLYKKLETYGVIPELLGRIGNVIVMDDITKTEYKIVLNSPYFLMNQWLNFFETLDPLMVNTFRKELDEDKVVEEACNKNLGIRGLLQVTQYLINDFILQHEDYFKYRTQDGYKFKE